MFHSILNDEPLPDRSATRRDIPNAPPSAMSEVQRIKLKEDAAGRCVLWCCEWSLFLGETRIVDCMC